MTGTPGTSTWVGSERHGPGALQRFPILVGFVNKTPELSVQESSPCLPAKPRVQSSAFRDSKVGPRIAFELAFFSQTAASSIQSPQYNGPLQPLLAAREVFPLRVEISSRSSKPAMGINFSPGPI